MPDSEHQTFGALMRSGAARRPGEDAVVVDAERLSYADLADRAARVAGGLRDHGIERGDRVALWHDNGLDWIVAYFAVAGMGATLVPLNTRFRRGELAHTLELTRAKAIVVGPGHPSAPFPELVREVVGTPDGGAVRAPAFPHLRLAAAMEPARGLPALGRARGGPARRPLGGRARRRRVHPVHVGHDGDAEGRRAAHPGDARDGAADR